MEFCISAKKAEYGIPILEFRYLHSMENFVVWLTKKYPYCESRFFLLLCSWGAHQTKKTYNGEKGVVRVSFFNNKKGNNVENKAHKKQITNKKNIDKIIFLLI